MSVCQISVNEFGLFAALATHLKLTTFTNAVSSAELLSVSNCAALRAQYGLSLDSSEGIPLTYDDIEANALQRLAKRDFSGPCSGLIYNCVTNNGELFIGELSAPRSGETLATLAELQDMDSAVSKWIKTESARIERQTEDDAAFVEVGPLPKLTVDECRERMEQLGASRVIYAEFHINESDSMTDYWGCRSGRSVIIGFGTGKRESFKQLRAAAGEFPPTAEYAPGCDQWRVTAFRSQPDKYGCADREQLRDDQYRVMEFPTKEAAETYVADLIAKNNDDLCFTRFAQAYGVEYHHESFENRENYSMGGGNYLGRSRYSGWVVRSSTYPMAGEYFEAPKKVDTVARKSRTPKHPVSGESPTVEIAPHVAGATVEKHRHTKRDFDMWIVIPAERLDRATFDAFRAECELRGGWYSRQWGTTPGGFAFRSADAAQSFAVTFDNKPQTAPVPAELPADPVKTPCREIPGKLRALADAMESTIADKLREMTQNWTPKRGVEYASRRHDGNNLRDAQRALRVLADAHDAGVCPASLAGIVTKKEAIELTKTRVDTSGGYYSLVDTGELSSKSPKAAELRQFVASFKSADDIASETQRIAHEAIQRKIDDLRGVKIEGFFPTPAGLVSDMVAAADIRDGHTVLEPSAGIGSIADVIAETAEVSLSCIEIRPSLVEILKLKGHSADTADFLELSGVKFDRIVMNPPFERGQDMRHVQHAYRLLADGGRLVALVANSAAFNGEFSRWLESVGGESTPIAAGAFNGSDAFNRTGVSVQMIVIDAVGVARESLPADLYSANV